MEQDKKSIIKQAARELFFQFGFSKTSMEDIAAHSGLAKPSVYYYFDSKEAIFNDVVLEEAQHFMDAIEARLPVDLEPDKKLGRFLWMVYDDMKLYAEKMSDVPKYLCEHSPHGHPIVEKLNDMFRARLHPMLMNGTAQGIFQIDDVDTTAKAIVYMTEFINHDWMNAVEEGSRDAIVNSMIKIILTGLQKGQ